jgi:ABC-type multidrug transport system ATPase subunit
MVNSIEVTNAEKYYGSNQNKKKILDGLNMTIRSGSM